MKFEQESPLLWRHIHARLIVVFSRGNNLLQNLIEENVFFESLTC